MKVIYPPYSTEGVDSESVGFARRLESMSKFRVFLAGSIEMNKAVLWQDELIQHLKDNPIVEDEDLVILNPRRPDWNSEWNESSPEFHEQVQWELRALEYADLIVFYFQPGTVSPISLLELGMYISSGKIMVCCPPGYHRKGNIDITCTHHGVPVYHDWEAFKKAVRQVLNEEA
jgi:hypothetical protein